MRSKTPSYTSSLLLMHLITLLLGISFTLIPSAAGFLISENGMQLSKLDYGNLFIVMISGSLFTSYFAGNAVKKTGVKDVLLFGVIITAVSMGLFSLEKLFLHETTISYSLLMWVMFFLGCGFGSLLTSLSTYAFRCFSSASETPLTALYIVLSIGSALGPLLFTLFLSLDMWWMAPLMTASALIILGIFSMAFFPKVKEAGAIVSFSISSLPPKKIFWVFALLALLYGLCETLIGTWGTVFLEQDKEIAIPVANYALSLFWLSISAGRILISVFRSNVSNTILFCLLPLFMMLGFIFIAKASSQFSLLLAFSFTGLGCSGFLPLILSVSQKVLPKTMPAIAGAVSGLYIIGYGLASSGMASLERRSGLPLSALFIIGSASALILGMLTQIALKKKRLF